MTVTVVGFFLPPVKPKLSESAPGDLPLPPPPIMNFDPHFYLCSLALLTCNADITAPGFVVVSMKSQWGCSSVLTIMSA